MALRKMLSHRLKFNKMMIKFKNSLQKSNIREFLVDLEISKINDKWKFELKDGTCEGSDNDLFLHELYELDDENMVWALYYDVIRFHKSYAKQSNVRIWCWNNFLENEYNHFSNSHSGGNIRNSTI